MLITFISWLWIGGVSFLSGYMILNGMFAKMKGTGSLDLYIMMGLCVLTVYAQGFSLFYKVGAIAVICMMVFLLIGTVIIRKQLIYYIKNVVFGLNLYRIIAVVLISGLVLVITVQYPSVYDTNLYHAQSIRWIEEYGAVKGIGNLNCRLAYNSAFFSLQALFSMNFLLGQSLHTLNGFFVTFMLIYVAVSMGPIEGKRFATSDLFKLGIVYYLFVGSVKYCISSPGSDISALLVVLYLGAKWCESMEAGEEKAEYYGILSLLAVWGATLKLSAAMSVLYAIYPAILFLRKKQWKSIGLFLGAGIIIALPFVIRNVIISGYLIYPYAAIDLFDVDWKLQASTLIADNQEIRAWARGITVPANYTAPISEWWPIWYGSLTYYELPLLWATVPCGLFAIAYLLHCVIRRKEWLRCNLIVTCIGGVVMWFVTAPSMRYGGVYLMLMPILAAGIVLDYCSSYLREKRLQTIQRTGAIVILILSYVYEARIIALTYHDLPLLTQGDYGGRAVVEYEWEGYTIYAPADSDSTGYYYFPAVASGSILESVELRTGNIEDGFRLIQK